MDTKTSTDKFLEYSKNMRHRLTTKSIFLDKQTLWLLGIFFGLRALSFFLYTHAILEGMLVFTLLMIFAMVYFKNTDWAWMILLGELFLGGAGHFLELAGLSMRTILVVTFVFLWLSHHASIKILQHKLHISHRLYYLFIPLACFVGLGAILGMVHGHKVHGIVADVIPYSFFILLLPFYHQFQKKQTKEYLIRLMLVYLLGSAVFALFTFMLYSGGLSVLFDPYYHWFRGVAMGKITYLANGFFRIVVPEHLLIVPAMLLIASLLMRDETHHRLWRFFLACGMLVFVLNFSRTYMLAFAVGFIILKYKHSFKRWLAVSSFSLLLFLLLFGGTSFIASNASSLGFNLLGDRFKSLIEPETERSSYTRMTILSPIFTIIQQHPVLGVGFGASISFLDPVDFKNITTTQFDWGYFELIAEIGMLGLLSFLAIIFIALLELVVKIESLSDYHDFYVGILGGLVALLVMNLTAPALFHVLGVFYLVMVFVLAMKPIIIFDDILTHLYRVFHRLRD